MNVHNHILNPPPTAQEQVNLPASIALRLCLQGIRSRLGRSFITVFGIVLGVAFLSSVVAGVLIKEAVAAREAWQRQVERRSVLLRGQVGRFDGKSFLIVSGGLSDADAGLVRDLIRLRHTRVAAVGPPAPLPGTVGAGELIDPILVCLGQYGPVLAGLNMDLLRRQPVYAFTAPTAELPAGVRVHVLSLELRPNEVARAEQRKLRDRQRTLWLVVVSLLITTIGIANAMLMSVTERVREIGTLKCLGALSSLVVRLFLIESAIVGLIGALAGTVLGVALACIGYGYLFGLSVVLTNLSYGLLAAAALGCVVIGVVLAITAAIYPAQVAAKMIPASALASNV